MTEPNRQTTTGETITMRYAEDLEAQRIERDRQLRELRDRFSVEVMQSDGKADQ